MHGNSVAKDLWYQQGFKAEEKKTTTQSKFAAHAQQVDCQKIKHCTMSEPVYLPHQRLLSPSSSVNEHVNKLDAHVCTANRETGAPHKPYSNEH